MKTTKPIISISLLFTLLFFLPGCAVKEGRIYEKDGKVYGTVDGLFKEKWNDYYLRGLSYAGGKFWNDAAADFEVSLSQRNKDKRRARTYGMHFIDYFPNRELGIALFNLGKFNDSIELLETSLSQAETARAKFYLNRARKSWLNESRLDNMAPVLSVMFPPPVYLTNDFSIEVRGTAKDNFFVSQITFNDKPTLLELSQKEFSFFEKIPLPHEENNITIQAEDLLGKTSLPITLRIMVDREGPLVSLGAIKGADGSISVTGALYDKSSVDRFSLNNRRVFSGQSRLLKVDEHIMPEQLYGKLQIPFEANDIAGNKTTGHIQILAAQIAELYCPLPQIAFARTDSAMPVLPRMRLPGPIPLRRFAAVSNNSDTSAVNDIHIRGVRDGQTIFVDAVFIEGTAFAQTGIKEITINGQPLLNLETDEALASFLMELIKKKKKSLSFSKFLKLSEGKNTITIELIDAEGVRTAKSVTVTRKIPVIQQIGSRLAITVYPFKEKNKTDDPLTGYIQTFLNHAFVNQKRFNVLERSELNRILEEQQISQEEIFSRETAVLLGRMMAAESIVVGDVFATEESVEIVARMVDTETSLILAEKDVYWEGAIRSGFREILDGLALKFKQHFPMCEGKIISKKSKEVIFNLGNLNSISRGMRLLSFNETVPIIDHDSGSFLGTDTEILGLLSTTKVHEKFSNGNILKTFTSKEINVGDKVITK